MNSVTIMDVKSSSAVPSAMVSVVSQVLNTLSQFYPDTLKLEMKVDYRVSQIRPEGILPKWQQHNRTLNFPSSFLPNFLRKGNVFQSGTGVKLNTVRF